MNKTKLNQKEIIDIFLITYNRVENLKKTLSTILSTKSPIRNYSITILDNNSTDNTKEIVNQYMLTHPNLKYLKHRRNIGGNANIVECFRLASKPYFWILCDDDMYDWSSWNEIEFALKNKYDVIMTKRLYKSTNIPLDIIANELTFVPAAIYKTNLINSDVLQVAYYNIYTSFPHFSIIGRVINEKRSIYVINNPIIKQGGQLESKSYTRGVSRYIHPRQKNTNLIIGYILSFRLIKNKKLRYRAYNHLYLGKGFFSTAFLFLSTNKNSWENIIIFFIYISLLQKVEFVIVLIYYYFFPKFFSKNNKIYVRLFGAKIKLFGSNRSKTNG